VSASRRWSSSHAYRRSDPQKLSPKSSENSMARNL